MTAVWDADGIGWRFCNFLTHPALCKLVPAVGFEPTTNGLQRRFRERYNRCSSPLFHVEPHRLDVDFDGLSTPKEPPDAR